jgi:6-phosphogluconolactonase
MKPTICSSSLETAHSVISHIIETIKSDPNKIVNIAFSGGETPGLMFDLWANKYADITPWKQLNIWWAEERCVPPEHSDSNYRLVRTLLLDHVAVPRNQVFRIRGESDPQKEAARYSELAKKNLPLQEGYPTFDIVLLGTNSEGDTSSIFSGQEQLLSSRQVYEVCCDPHDGQTRISLTGTPIIKSKQVLFLITGKSKAKIVHEICTTGDTSSAAYIFHHANRVEMFLDAGAASLLE